MLRECLRICILLGCFSFTAFPGMGGRNKQGIHSNEVFYFLKRVSLLKELNSAFEEQEFKKFWEKAWAGTRIFQEKSLQSLARNPIYKRLLHFLNTCSVQALEACFSDLASFYDQKNEMREFITDLTTQHLFISASLSRDILHSIQYEDDLKTLEKKLPLRVSITKIEDLKIKFENKKEELTKIKEALKNGTPFDQGVLETLPPCVQGTLEHLKNNYQSTQEEVKQAIQEDNEEKLLKILRKEAPSINSYQVSRLKKNLQPKQDFLTVLMNKVIDESLPTHLIFYLLLKEKYPSLSWKGLNPQIKSPPTLMFKGIPFQRRQPSLASLLLNEYETETRCLTDCREVFKKIDVLSAHEDVPPFLKDLLTQPSQAKPITFVSAVCPDYAAEQDINGNYRYTFQSLGSGIGVVARRFMEALPALMTFFHQHNLKVRLKVALGDFEAFSQSTLKKLQLTSQEFGNRLKGSQVALREEIERLIQEKKAVQNVAVEVGLFTDLFGGADLFRKTCEDFELKFKQNNYEHASFDQKKIERILNARKPLYTQWHGDKSDQEYLSLLKAQGAEYATMGKLIQDTEKDFFVILQADHNAMESFWHAGGVKPLCYLKNPNYS